MAFSLYAVISGVIKDDRYHEDEALTENKDELHLEGRSSETLATLITYSSHRGEGNPMADKKLNLGKVVWYDESYENKKTGKRENPYPGVVYLLKPSCTPNGKPARTYYIRYRTPDGRQHFEPCVIPGVKMTPAKARGELEARAAGKKPTNRNRREAQQAAKEAAKAEKKAVDSRWDFSRLFDAYTTARGTYARKVTDAANYRVHLAPVVAKKTPGEITSFDVDRIKHRMKQLRKVTLKSRKDGGKDRVVTKGSCKPGTVVAALGFLVRLASFGVKRNLCEGIKFRVELPKVSTGRTEQMSDEQMTAYLKAAAACENKVIGSLLQFELLTGMRFGEVQKLVKDDVDLQRGAVHLRDPKGGKDQFLPLNPAAVELLNQLPRNPENPLVFQGDRRKNRETGLMEARPIGNATAARYGRKFALAAGLPKDFRPNHGLRHAYASALASSGEVDMYVLQKLLTHKSPQMTQRYAHLRDDTLRRGADVMSRIVSSAAAAGRKKSETA
jgi:integrase